MIGERFIKMLNDPELLKTISYEELKTLALAYPYAHNLRYLLALKAKQEDRPDAARTLATAAAYSLDRTQLFLLYAPKILTPQRVSEELNAEVLELKPIGVVRQELEALTPVKRVETPEPAAAAAPIPTPMPTPTPPVATPSPQKQNFYAWYGQFNLPPLTPPPPRSVVAPSVISIVPMPETGMVPILPPKPKAETIAPRISEQIEAGDTKDNENVDVVADMATIIPAQPTPADTESDPSPGAKAQVLAERSVSENKDVASETLARILAKQGYKDKAIAMYERLCLVIPEKSPYFAAEIEKLKK